MSQITAMDIRARWNHTTRRLDELPPSQAALAGFAAFLGAGLVVLRLPTWAFIAGLLTLLLLLVWLALSGKPVVKLVFSEETDTRPGATERVPPPVRVRVAELLEMVELEGGEFWMGSPESEAGRDPDEARHRVRVSAFAMAKYPVTQGQYAEIMGENPSYFQEPGQGGERPKDRPVERVSWFDAVRFCNRLSEREGWTPCYRLSEPEQGSKAQPLVDWDREAGGYRLPTEAEWEYACRAGTETAYCFGDDAAQLSDYAWFRSNSNFRTHTIGEKKPNSWGLHDLHGNVWEWCWDWFGADQITNGTGKGVALNNPVGPSSGSRLVLRGGAFFLDPRLLRSAHRVREEPGNRSNDTGFRCVRGSLR